MGIFDNLSVAVSYNSQREERVNQGGQGNPKAEIIHDWERTSSHGFSFYLDRQLPRRNGFSLGGDLYRDHVYASSYSWDPVGGTATPVRPRVPTARNIFWRASICRMPSKFSRAGCGLAALFDTMSPPIVPGLRTARS